jgi:N-acetylneuraminate synthase
MMISNMTIGRKTFDFNNLFTFELANNHQGDVSHGRRIIQEVGAIAKEFNLKAAVKLQFRDLDTFIHPAYKERQDLKHIPRFMSTRLSRDEFASLVAAIKNNGLISMATPFDEPSVDLLLELGVDIVKVASASAKDWPLLQKVAEAGKPVIVSVGGLTLKEVDNVVSFFDHRGVDFALMHCVAIYPTPPQEMYLRQIEVFRNRYPHLTIGFSTHESPTDFLTSALAYAKGARIFEKHVGLPTETIKLNAYSANPTETRAWVRSIKLAEAACGDYLPERLISLKEQEDLKSLERAVFAKGAIKAGQSLKRDDVFFAMPTLSDDDLRSGDFREGMIADRDYTAGQVLSRRLLTDKWDPRAVIYHTVHQVKGMLNQAKIHLSHEFMVEISHHYGLERFHEVGCVIIDCFNREYAKKLVIQLPGQWHPVHYHKSKDETFQVLFGSMEVEVEGRPRLMRPGEVIWIPRGVWHGFKTDSGVIFEEISTTAKDSVGDSFYIDKVIAKKPREDRKTRLLNWGRHQFD